MSPWLPILIALLALGFTVFSFWWMNWRPGVLRVGDIRYFAAGKATEGMVEVPNVNIVALPLILYNTGARPVVVESMRLVDSAEIDSLGTLEYEAVDTPLWSLQVNVERNHFFLPTLLKANEVIRQNFVFQRRLSPYQFKHRIYHLELEAKISGRDWIQLKRVELDFRDTTCNSVYELNNSYLVYPRRPKGGGVASTIP